MRLIDADILRQAIIDEFRGKTAGGFIRYMRDKKPIEVYNSILHIIDNAPTVEQEAENDN